MKTSLLLAASFLSVPLLARADAIAQWGFNGTNTASLGAGTAVLIGGISAGFATGCTNDPAASNLNQGWNTSSYPAQGTSNKMAGIQFNVSTLGYSDILVRWDQRVSATASRYYRLQYSADGLNFFDYPTPIASMVISSTGSFYEAETNDLSSFSELNDNPYAAFRIVAEFENSALPGGVEGYATTYGTNTYSRSGTVRFDMLTVCGAPIPGANTPPRISHLGDQIVRVNQATGDLPFTVWDAEDQPADLAVRSSSSDPVVVPEGNIVLGGNGSNRTVRVTAGSRAGAAVISLTATDSGGRSNTTSFALTVLPLNTAPVISFIVPTNTLMNTATAPLSFTVGDMESGAESLGVSGYSLNPALVPNDSTHIVLGGTATNRTLTLIPSPGQTGVAPIRLTVSDGALAAETYFPLMVVPSAEMVFYDPFDYPDGSVLTNSAFLWENRSGTAGQCQIRDGQLEVTTTQTEDVSTHLFGGPFARSNSIVLYAAFKVRFLSLPKAVPCYFAHFVGGSSLRGRIYAAAADSLPGCFHLGVANGSDTNTMLSANLSTNTTYLIVTRYDVDAAATTFWVNPSAESDPGVAATDPQTAVSISAYGFRQDGALGATLLVDDLKVGLSFAAVTGAGRGSIPLHIERTAGGVTLRWSDSRFRLQSGPAAAGPFTNVAGASSPFPASGANPVQFFRLIAD